jgi:hypothetical protein
MEDSVPCKSFNESSLLNRSDRRGELLDDLRRAEVDIDDEEEALEEEVPFRGAESAVAEAGADFTDVAEDGAEGKT